MVCIYCGQKTQVINSRHQKKINQVWRRRQCIACKAVFTTEESAALASEWLVHHKTHIEPFSRDKLLISLYSSLQHRKTAVQDANGLTLTIMQKLQQTIKDGSLQADTIQAIVQITLNRFDRATSTHYQAFHQ